MVQWNGLGLLERVYGTVHMVPTVLYKIGETIVYNFSEGQMLHTHGTYSK